VMKQWQPPTIDVNAPRPNASVIASMKAERKRRLGSAYRYAGNGGIPHNLASQMCKCSDKPEDTDVDALFGFEVQNIKKKEDSLGGKMGLTDGDNYFLGTPDCLSYPPEMINILELFPYKALFGMSGKDPEESGARTSFFGAGMKWFLSNKLGTMKCTGSKEGDPVGILGYLNLPLEGADIPYQIIVFADGTKPSSSMLKVSLDKLGLVEMFREWKASIGVDRDDQWNSEIASTAFAPSTAPGPTTTTAACRRRPRAASSSSRSGRSSSTRLSTRSCPSKGGRTRTTSS